MVDSNDKSIAIHWMTPLRMLCFVTNYSTKAAFNGLPPKKSHTLGSQGFKIELFSFASEANISEVRNKVASARCES